MMQKMVLLLCFFAMGSIWAGGMDSDTPDRTPEQAAPVQLRTQAMEHFIRAMMEKDPQKRLPELLKSLKADPEAKMPLQILSEMYRTQPEPIQKQVAEGVLTIAEKNPASILLNLTAVKMAEKISREMNERAKKAAAAVIRRSKNGTPRDAFMGLVGVHLQDLVMQENWEEAYNMLQAVISHADDPELALYDWAGSVSKDAARRASPERRWLGLRESERAVWKARQQKAVELSRKNESKLENLRAVEHLTDFYIRMRCPEDALRLTNEATKKFTGNTDAEFLRLTTLLRLRRYQEALLLAEKLTGVSPQSPGCLMLLGQCAMHCGEYEKALQTGRKLLQVKPDSTEARYFITLALIFNKKMDEAAKEIIAIQDPESRTMLESFLRHHTESRSVYLERLRKLQKNPNYNGGDAIYIPMLTIAEQTNDVNLLEECWQNMEKMGSLADPTNANNVGYVAAKLGHRLPEAGKLLRFALDAEPENGAYLDSMAWYLYCTGSYEEAWQMIQLAIEAMEEEPSQGVVLEHAGDIALKLGKKEEALQLYYQALGDFLSPDLDLQAVRKKIEQVKKELNGGKDKK